MNIGLRSLCLFSLLAVAPAFASEKILGLLALPKTFGIVDPNGAPGLAAPAKLQPTYVYAKPDQKSRAISKILKLEDAPTLEYGYEKPGLVVYEKTSGWFRVALSTGTGWVRAEKTGNFREYPKLVKDGLSYLTEHWDGTLRPSPNESAAAAKVAGRPKEGAMDARVHEIMNEKIGLWFRVEALNPGHCQTTDAKPVAAGWVPGYAPSGKETVWFFSRGC